MFWEAKKGDFKGQVNVLKPSKLMEEPIFIITISTTTKLIITVGHFSRTIPLQTNI